VNQTNSVITVDTSGKVNKTLFVNQASDPMCLLIQFVWEFTVDIPKQMVRWNAKTEELFDGSVHGRITTVEVLPPSTARSPTNHQFLCAMASKDTVFVMTLEPAPKICYTMDKPEGVGPGAMPYLSWRPDTRRGKDALKQNGDPMLVIAW
jgi:hypothetical protein